MPSNRSLTTHKTARPISLCQGAIAIGLHKACLLNSEQRFSNNFNVVWWTAAKQVSQFCYISMFMIVLQFQSWNHRKSLWFPVTCISKVWGQQTYAACTLDKQTIANNLSCSLYVLNTLPRKTMCFSLWAKFIQIILRVLPSTWQIRSNPQGKFQLTRSPSRHWDGATNPNFMHYCKGNHWRFPKKLV